MDRITGNTIDIGGGRRGFRGRDVMLGQAGTIPGPVWFNGIQEEMARAIEICGLTLTDANREQLIQAMRRLAGGNVRTLTVNTSLTPDDAGLVIVNVAASRTFTLPLANAAGGLPLRFVFHRIDSSLGTVSIGRAGADTINALPGPVQLPIGGVLSLMSDGAAGWIITGAQGYRDLRVLSTPGTTAEVVPIWARRAFVRGVGGGGGGGGANAGGVPTGGAGGGYGEDEYQVWPGESISCTVGAGGAGGAGGPGLTNGAPGGTTSFGSRMVCTGGGQGVAANGGIQTAGVVGGTCTGAARTQAGGPVQAGAFSAPLYFSSPGGSSALAPQGAIVVGTGSPGNSAIAPGMGGSGATNVGAGGNGANGLLMIEFRP